MSTDRDLPRTAGWLIDGLYAAVEITDALLKDLGIPYTMIGGTLLGAVRHGGMIPWDDDIDLAIRSQDAPALISHAHPFLRTRGYSILNWDHLWKIFPLDSPRVKTWSNIYTRPRSDSIPLVSVDVFEMEKVEDRWILSPEPVHDYFPDEYLEADDFEDLHYEKFGPLWLSSVSRAAALRYLTTTYGETWCFQAEFRGTHYEPSPVKKVRIESFEPAVPSFWESS